MKIARDIILGNCTNLNPLWTALINGGGKEVESTQEILEATHSFYANLYKEQSIDEVIVESFISKLTKIRFR